MARGVYDRIAVDGHVGGMEYAQALLFRQHLRQQAVTYFRGDVDILAMPATPFTAPLIDPMADIGFSSISHKPEYFRWSMAGVPTLSFPSGFGTSALPTVLQLAGPRWPEARLVIAGKAFQGATDWHRHAPLCGKNGE
ncbi:MAG: amidase family protein [Alphaproteobacteria bacterium]|nr:amidase family protein [Alphaproteobacteria bacterium]